MEGGGLGGALGWWLEWWFGWSEFSLGGYLNHPIKRRVICLQVICPQWLFTTDLSVILGKIELTGFEE
jgi:hypothetical protein